MGDYPSNLLSIRWNFKKEIPKQPNHAAAQLLKLESKLTFRFVYIFFRKIKSSEIHKATPSEFMSDAPQKNKNKR